MAVSQHSPAVPDMAAGFHLLLEMEALSVGEYRCAGCPAKTAVETATHPEIVMPRQGAYVREDEMGSIYLDRTVVGFFEAGRPYVIRHLEARPDVTTVISLLDPAAGGRTFRRAAVRATPQLHARHRALLRLIGSSRTVSLKAEEETVLLADEAIRLTEDSDELAQGSGWERDICVAAGEYLNRHYRRRIALQDLAAHTGYSVFHLCRMFQAQMKTSIYKYLTLLRLEAAMAELVETDAGITALALGLGFSSHSHFTAQFSRHYGITPSEARRGKRPSARY